MVCAKTKTKRVAVGLWLAALSWLFWAEPCVASYRVYKLKIKHYDTKGKLTRNHTVMSFLDAYQYPAYYGTARITVEMLDTWYCPGDTHSREMCQKPKPKMPTRGLASTEPTRPSIPYNRQPVRP